VEPALQKTSRSLTLFRDQLASSGDLFFPVPCGHAGRCPLNQEPRDWCHFDVGWEPLRSAIESRARWNIPPASSNTLFSPYAWSGTPYSSITDIESLSDRLKTREGEVVLLCAPDQKLKSFSRPKNSASRPRGFDSKRIFCQGSRFTSTREAQRLRRAGRLRSFSFAGAQKGRKNILSFPSRNEFLGMPLEADRKWVVRDLDRFHNVIRGLGGHESFSPELR